MQEVVEVVMALLVHAPLASFERSSGGEDAEGEEEEED